MDKQYAFDEAACNCIKEDYLHYYGKELNSSAIGIRNAIGTFNEETQRLFKLRYIDKLSFERLSRQSSISAVAARTRIINHLGKFSSEYLRDILACADGVMSDYNSRSIFTLGLSTRTCNVLYGNGIRTVGNLVVLSYEQLCTIPFLGKVSVNEIQYALNGLGYKLEMPSEVKYNKRLMPKIGDTFTILGAEWKIIDDFGNSYLCLGPELKESYIFAPLGNDWNDCSLRSILNTTVYKEITSVVGNNSIIPYTRKLLVADCKHEYNSCNDRVSIMTVDEYRKYINHMGNVNRTWLMTAYDYQGDSILAVYDGEVKPMICSQEYYVRPVCRIAKDIVAKM